MRVLPDTRGLTDPHGRRLRKLRVSLTDACNFRCFYCMPSSPRFLPANRLLRTDEIVGISSVLVELGLEEIRITGGEPTVRNELPAIVEGLSRLGMKKLGLTSNGLLLGRYLDFLAGTECRHLNISLDSLRSPRFRSITGIDGYAAVMENIERAAGMGFQVKLNTVVMRGVNDDELLDFVRFSERTGISVRFLELMKVGPRHAQFDELFVSAGEMLERLGREYDLIPKRTAVDSTSFVYETESGASLGFIASETMPFCSSCSRLRLSATGTLRACLMSDAGLNLRGLERGEMETRVRQVIKWKPTGRIHHTGQAMNQIGG